ncbi:MAG: cytochrome c biogenesis protein CcdA [Acidobacteriia bacterium]|nr:cytochrome c biogenesis protein CcdA [Terriglobia bacterium]
MSSLPLPIAAFVAGLMSFLSPCVLPLVPGYVSLISGSTIDELKDPEKRLTKTVLGHSIMFILGFSVVFISLGAVATEVGQIIHENLSILSKIAGVVIVIFGLHLTGIFKINALYSDKRMHSVQGGKSPVGAFVIGFAFAFGWTPCIGPILATILALAASTGTIAKGILLLAVYSLGLAVPFLLTSLGIDRFLSFYGRFRRHLHTVEVLSGILLIVIGVLIFFRHFTVLSGYLSFLNRFTTL